MSDFEKLYGDAINREETVRIVAFLGLTESIAGCESEPLTCTHLAILAGIQSPFICGQRVPTAEDVAAFLWVVSPDWRPGASTERQEFLRKARLVDYGQAVIDINKYLDDTFLDSLGGKQNAKQPKAFVSWMAVVVDELASEYHWREADILKLPLKRLWQYRRCIRLRRDPKAVMFNRSDRVIGDEIDRMNAEKEKR